MNSRKLDKIFNDIAIYWQLVTELHPDKSKVIEDMVDELNENQDLSTLPSIIDLFIEILETNEHYEMCGDLVIIKERFNELNGKSRDTTETGNSNSEGQRIHCD